MSMISKFRSVPLTSAPESQPEVNNVQQTTLPDPSIGIANTNDSFETVDPLNTGIFEMIQQPSTAENQMFQPQPSIDASAFLDYLADVQDPQPPAPPESPEAVLNISSSVASDISDPVEQTVNDAIQFTEDAYNTGLNEGVKLFSAIADGFTDVGDVAEDAIKEISKPVGDLIWGNTVNDVVDFVSTEVVDRGLNAMRDVGLEGPADWIQDTGGDVIRFAGDVVKETGDIAEDVVDGVGDAASDVGDFAEDVLDTVSEPVAGLLTGETIDDVINAGKDGVDAIGDAASDVGDALGDAADGAGEVIDDIGDAAGDGLDAIGDAAGDVGDWLDDIDWP